MKLQQTLINNKEKNEGWKNLREKRNTRKLCLLIFEMGKILIFIQLFFAVRFEIHFKKRY